MINKNPDITKEITIELSNPSFDIAMQYAIIRAEEHARVLGGEYKPISIKLTSINAKYVYKIDKCKSVYKFKSVYSEDYR